MSGIIGTYHPDGAPADAAGLHRMLARMAHRGPDGQDLWTDGAVGLGHGLLQTTSAQVRQPIQRGPLCLTADARIDNRATLIRALGLEEEARTLDDGELILRAYERWGLDCVDHLLGAFAFALWDGRTRRLVCVRDPMGIRPLYYRQRPDGRLLIASEIKAILAYNADTPPLNEERLLDLLLRMRVEPEATIYQGVKRLPPGHRLVARPDSLAVTSYWTLTPDETVSDDWSDAAYAERFRALFEEAVRCRTRSAHPVGADLSGGLDSSAVACVARDVLDETGGGPLHTFSYTFDRAATSDEREYAEAVLAQGGFAPHWLSGDDVGPLSHLDTIYGAVVDDYLVGGMHYMIWKSYAAAQAEGVRVMMNGFDGDTTVSHGVLRLKELAQAGRWVTFGREVRQLAQRHTDLDHRQPFEDMLGSAGALFEKFARPELERLARQKRWWAFARAARGLSRHFTVTPYGLTRHYARPLLLPGRLQGPAPADRKQADDGAARDAAGLEIVRDEVARRLDVADRLRAARTRRASSFDGVRARQAAQFGRASMTEGLEAMNHYGAYHRLEPRFPFMDVRLVRYCLALPSAQSLQGGWTRVVLRRAMKGVLPEQVRRRVGKARMWAANRRALLEANGDVLRRHVQDLGPVAALVDPAAIQQLFARRYDLKPHEFILLQRTVTLAAWAKLRFGLHHAS